MKTVAAKNRVFVGSSVEGLVLAEAVASYLEPEFEPLLWKRGLFRPGLYSLEALDEAVRSVSFAVIVGTPDDELTKRGVTNDAIRDNLVFELGLFSGALGRKRALLLVPEGVRLALPSDLNGLTLAQYVGRAEDAVSKATLDALQVGVVEIRTAFLLELADQEKEDKARLAALVRGQKLGAVSRLFQAVVQLRDLCIELPGQVLGSLDELAKFNAAKAQAAAKVAELHDEWRRDAVLVGVSTELEALAVATRRTILAFPFPAVMFSDDEAVSVGKRMLLSGVQAYQSGAGVGQAAHVGFGQGVAEAEARVQNLGDQYAAWWQGQAVELRTLANALSDRLAKSAVALGFERTEL